MTSVLIVDDDVQLRRALVRSLRVNGYESGVAANFEEALKCVQLHSYDVVLTDLRMAGKDGIELVGELTRMVPLTKAILMSAFASARDSQRAYDKGAVSILCKPFDTLEMLRAVDRAAETRSGFRGSVHGLSLLDMLQMFHCAHRSLTLMVAGEPSGFIHLREGEVIHATHGRDTGLAALRGILGMPAGSLETRALEGGGRSVHEPFPQLLERLLADLPVENASQGLPSDIKSILESGANLRAPIELPADPAFPDVFGEFSKSASHRRDSLPPALTEEEGGELAIAQELCRVVSGARCCGILALREGGGVHYSGQGASVPDPTWLEAVRALLAVTPSIAPGKPTARAAAGCPHTGELQLGLPEGVLLSKVTGARRSAVLLWMSPGADMSAAWVSLRNVVGSHETLGDK